MRGGGSGQQVAREGVQERGEDLVVSDAPGQSVAGGGERGEQQAREQASEPGQGLPPPGLVGGRRFEP